MANTLASGTLFEDASESPSYPVNRCIYLFGKKIQKKTDKNPGFNPVHKMKYLFLTSFFSVLFCNYIKYPKHTTVLKKMKNVSVRQKD